MKKLILVLGLLLLPTISHSWEFNRNPDRFPSLGFNASTSKLEGHRIEDSHPAHPLTRIDGGPESLNLSAVGADVRLPLSQDLTFSLAYDHLESSSKFRREPDIFKESTELSGYNVKASVRLYFNK